MAAGFVGQVRTLCDIGEMCRRYGDVIDWRQLVARARTYDMEKPLYYALRLAREMVGAGVPSEALRELRASFGQLPLEERVITAVARRAILCDDQDTSAALEVLPAAVCVCWPPVARETASRWPIVTWLRRARGACGGSPINLGRGGCALRWRPAWTVACHRHRAADLSPSPGS